MPLSGLSIITACFLVLNEYTSTPEHQDFTERPQRDTRNRN